MAIHLYDLGAEYMLGVCFDDASSWPKPTYYQVMLFTNNINQAQLDAEPTLTEAFGGGYTRRLITVGGTTAPATEQFPIDVTTRSIGAGSTAYPTAIATAEFTPLPFPLTGTFTGPLTTNTIVYGYAVLQGSVANFNEADVGVINMNKVVFADILKNPFTPEAGNSLTIDITFKLCWGSGTEIK